ncbi:MAG: hypothetical protein OXQ29_02945 [Rhodospirillaceae bacterium]|nr:hypothetical protein [Rhodospirillaceae bacterium]
MLGKNDLPNGAGIEDDGETGSEVDAIALAGGVSQGVASCETLKKAGAPWRQPVKKNAVSGA